MVKGWVTVLVVAFGVVAAIIGVVAYLRLYKKQAGFPPADGGSVPPAADETSASVEEEEQHRK